MKPLHYKKHTLAKRGLSLLCILALCLGLLPATALAAGEIKLFIGGQQITESGCYEKNQDGDWTKVEDSDGTEPASGQFYYDAATATLTLNQAKIVNYQDVTVGGGFTYPGSVIAYSQSADVSLTIVVSQGTSTITGTGGIRVMSEAGDASLSISGPGSLEVNVDMNDSGISLIGSKNVNLNIDGADVTASSSVYGVQLQAGEGYKIAATINDGNLTASGSTVGFYYSRPYGSTTGGLSSLIVSGNAVVDTEGSIEGILNSRLNSFQVGADGESGGIVFNGKSGTVYGNVTLQDDLEIKSGESLTVGKDASLTVPDGKTLTNDGTINVESGGKLEGTTTGNGTLKIAPTITTQPQDVEVKENETATFNVKVTGTEPLSYQWQQSTDNGQSWTDITGETNATYTIAATSTGMSGTQYRCVVSNSAGSVTSSAATLTVTQPVTGVTLDKETLDLFTGESETLTATVAPETATNKSVTWQSNNANVATVEGGVVTAKGAGEATITVTTQDGGKTDTCTVTVTDKTYMISADTTALNFGSAYTGYAQPAAKTVTLTNTGNQQVTVTLPTANDFIITAGTGFTDGSAAIKPGETATFTVQPKTGLSVGTYSETIEVTGTEGTTVTIPASFTVKSRPSYNPPTVSEETIDAINDAEPGETVSVALKDGDTTLDAEVFETLAGRDITLEIALEGGVTWSVNGQDIPADANLDDLDLGVEMNSDGIPVDVVNSITGERGTVQMTLAHDGDFGFTMTLTAPLGKENAGYWANLYHYDEDADQLTFETAAEIDADGSVSLPMSHASQYAIVIDTHSHATVDVSDIFLDVTPNAWYKDAVQYAYDNGLMTGVSATEFAPEQTTTRAMIVSILARLENVTTAQAAGFTDVDDNDWYATAVNWAANVGVVNGYEDNTFKPNTAITREQLAAILMNYAAYKGYDVSARADLSHYSDADSISSWANDVLLWAVAEGLLTGVTDDTIAPQAHATRAQVAAILQRFLSE